MCMIEHISQRFDSVPEGTHGSEEGVNINGSR